MHVSENPEFTADLDKYFLKTCIKVLEVQLKALLDAGLRVSDSQLKCIPPVLRGLHFFLFRDLYIHVYYVDLCT